MSEILYYILIYPLQIIIECIFMIAFFVLKNHIISIIVVSIFTNLLCLPFYIKSDRAFADNLKIKKELEPKLKAIKQNFKGDEKLFMIRELYKQHNYSPFVDFKSTLGLIIQIPFFIAAFCFFSHWDIIEYNYSYIHYLTIPDGLLSINHFKINVIPILMTLITIISGEIYIRRIKENKRLFVYLMSVIFFMFRLMKDAF